MCSQPDIVPQTTGTLPLTWMSTLLELLPMNDHTNRTLYSTKKSIMFHSIVSYASPPPTSKRNISVPVVRVHFTLELLVSVSIYRVRYLYNGFCKVSFLSSALSLFSYKFESLLLIIVVDFWFRQRIQQLTYNYISFTPISLKKLQIYLFINGKHDDRTISRLSSTKSILGGVVKCQNRKQH